MKKSSPQKKSFTDGYSPDGKAAVYTLAFAYLYLLAEIVYKMKVNREICSWEFLLLFLMFAAFGFFKKMFSNPLFLTDLNGNRLPLGSQKAEKKIRSGHYARSSFLYSAVFAVTAFLALLFSSDLNHLDISVEFLAERHFPNWTASLMLACILMIVAFPVVYMIEYLWYERKISLYQTLCDQNESPESKVSSPVSLPAAESDADLTDLSKSPEPSDDSPVSPGREPVLPLAADPVLKLEQPADPGTTSSVSKPSPAPSRQPQPSKAASRPRRSPRAAANPSKKTETTSSRKSDSAQSIASSEKSAAKPPVSSKASEHQVPESASTSKPNAASKKAATKKKATSGRPAAKKASTGTKQPAPKPVATDSSDTDEIL